MYSQCQGRNAQGNQCGRDWDLDDEGFCEQHRAGGPQCQGTTQKGLRCKIKKDLDDNGFCKQFHRNQAKPKPSTPPPARAQSPRSFEATPLAPTTTAAPAKPHQCRGTNTEGVRCRITWDLNDAALCKFHKNKPVRCHGVSSGSRCEAQTNIDLYGFCVDHATASDEPPSRSPVDAAQPEPEDAATSEGSASDSEGVATTELTTSALALVFGHVKKMRISKKHRTASWEIHKGQDTVVAKGYVSCPGVCLVPNAVDTADLKQYRLLVTVNDDNKAKVPSEPYDLESLRQKPGKVSLPGARTVDVSVLPVGGLIE